MTIFEWILAIPALSLAVAFLFSGIISAGIDFDAEDGVMTH